MEGFGVPKDMNKAEAFLKDASIMGNGQSSFQLFMLYCAEEKKDLKLAYKYLHKACLSGVTFFEQMNRFFVENYDAVLPMYLELKKPSSLVNIENRKEVENMHKGYTDELKKTFSAALSKDRMYHNPCGFIEDQQIWLMGVLLKYAVNSVLHMNHQDFMAALRCDLSPLLSYTGLWLLNEYK